MKFPFSQHVLEELEKRKIPQKLVEQVLYTPEQRSQKQMTYVLPVASGDRWETYRVKVRR
ncbi:MAG: hypothetical protein OJF51_000083 [Nitrospira sp.]|jgi:hypothetical protein|nr:MAG: hypothetical protein OJF51_000083 [Nitrospira sp.]